ALILPHQRRKFLRRHTTASPPPSCVCCERPVLSTNTRQGPLFLQKGSDFFQPFLPPAGVVQCAVPGPDLRDRLRERRLPAAGTRRRLTAKPKAPQRVLLFGALLRCRLCISYWP